MNMKKVAKKITYFRTNAKWFLVQEQSSFHLFGGCDDRVSIGYRTMRVLAMSKSDAVYRCVKRQERLHDFSLWSNRPDEVAQKWAKWACIEESNLDYKIQHISFFN